MAQAADFSIDWQHNWDDEVGLWRQHTPGHTAPIAAMSSVHAGPSASSRLLLAAQAGQLDAVQPARILSALRAMQLTEGPRRGCLKWYHEEPQPVDTNASFFIALSLIPLRKLYYAQLNTEARALLDALLADVAHWFAHEVEHRMFHYPNKFLGDIVCNWLLQEIQGRDPDPNYLAIMREAAEYWTGQGWGWGEHMSDTYAMVSLHELSLLLLLSERLPADLHATYTGLLADLLALEDQYDGGPRVPALRSYAFLESPAPMHYRDRIAPLPATLQLERVANMPLLGPLFAERGWHAMAPPRRERATNIVVPCFGGARAVARVEDDIRLGSMSHFPVMPSAEYPTWGLSWQCFPVAFSRGEGDWGFLQWEALEGERVAAHPANHKHFAYLHNSLTTQVLPPLVGQTYAMQHGGHLLALRIMPGIACGWTRVTDRLRLLGNHAEITEMPAQDSWSHLRLRYPERTVSIHHLALTGNIAPVLRADENGRLDWECHHADDRLRDRRMIASLWGISLHGEVTSAPVLTPGPAQRNMPRTAEEWTWMLQWEWPDITWQVVIDPLAAEPLRAVE